MRLRSSDRWQQSFDTAQRSPDGELRRSALARCTEAMRLFAGADAAAVLLPVEAGLASIAAICGGAPEGLEPGDAVASPFLRSRAPGTVWFSRASRLDPGDLLRADGRGQVAACALGVVGQPVALAVFWNRAPAPGAWRRHRVRQLAGFMAPEVERARLDDDERRSRLGAVQARRHLALVVDASAALAQALGEWGPALDALAGKIVPDHADFMAVDLIGTDGVLERQVSAHVDAALGQLARTPGDVHADWASTLGVVVEGGVPVVTPPALASRPGGTAVVAADDAVFALHDELQLTSWAVIPIRTRGLSIGALTIGTGARRRGLRPSDLAAFEDLAARVAVTVERVLLYRETQSAGRTAERNAIRLGRAVEAARSVTASLELTGVVRRAAEQAVRIMEAVCAVVVLSRDGQSPIVAASQDQGQPVEELVRIAEETLTAASPRLGTGPVPWIAVPMVVPGSETRGALVVSRADGASFTPEEESVLLLTTQVTAAAVAHAERFEAAAASEQRLRALVEASPLAIIEVDPGGRITAWNSAAAGLLGWDPGSAVAGPLHPDAVALLEEQRQRLLSGESVIDDRALLARHDAPPVEVSLAAALVRQRSADGEHRTLICVITDITERQQLEREVQQKHRMEALGRLAGGVAHDFNNLLTVIVGYSDLLATRLGPDHAMFADIDAIRAAGRRATTFTEQLLAMSQRRPVKPRIVDLGTIITDLQPVLRRLLGDHIDLRTELDAATGSTTIDQGQLEQVILNLVVNAGNAMPDAGRLTIATWHDGDRAILAVSDTGVGMDAATRERCFEPFFTTRAKDGGNGLGLSTVYGIVDQAGGHISLTSEPGQGTTFRVSLPRAAAQPTPPSEPEMAGSGNGTGDGGHRGVVLLAEDQSDVRQFTRDVLVAAGYAVIEAADGFEAARIVKESEQPLDLVVTDVVMAGQGGAEVAEVLAASRPGTPVLFVSGYMDDDRRERLGAMGEGRAFLAKPFVADQLLDAVQGLLP